MERGGGRLLVAERLAPGICDGVDEGLGMELRGQEDVLVSL